MCDTQATRRDAKRQRGPAGFHPTPPPPYPEQTDRLERIGALYARLRYGPGGDDDDPTGNDLERLIEEIGKRQ